VVDALMFCLMLAGCALAMTMIGCAEPALVVGTFNVRYDTEQDGPDAWSAGRRHRVELAIRALDPDVMAIQELLPRQLEELRADLADGWLLESADAGGSPQSNAILYRGARLRLTGVERRWLGPDPTIPGSRWGDAYPRVALRASLVDRLTGEAFRFTATHTNGGGPAGRAEWDQLMKEFAPQPGDILGGDFNELWGPNVWGLAPGGPRAREAGWDDLVGPATAPPAGWSGGPPGAAWDPTGRVDWLVGAGFEVLSSTVAPIRVDGRACSDHWPVTATVVR
jgi:endonuclease/exonuclease/phosphatase family metal-dependent hydrolase